MIPHIDVRQRTTFFRQRTHHEAYDMAATKHIARPQTPFGQQIRTEIGLNEALALAVARVETSTQPQGTINDEFQCSREGTTGKLRGHDIIVMHSCAYGTANAFWLVVYTGKGRFWHVDARRAFNNEAWHGGKLFGSDQRRRFLRDLNDRFESAHQFAEWCVAEHMPRIQQDLNQSPIEEPQTLAIKGNEQWTL